MTGIRRPSKPAAGQVDDLGGARQAEAQAAACLPPAIEWVEKVGRLAGTDPLAGIAERPDQLVVVRGRADLDPAAGRRRLKGVAKQDLGEVPQCVRIGPGRRRRDGSMSVTSRTPRAAHSRSKSRSSDASSSEGRHDRLRGAGGRATNIRSRRIRWARCAWLRMMRSDRATSGSLARASRQLRRGRRPRPAGCSARGRPPRRTRPGPRAFPAESLRLGLDLMPQCADDRLEPSLQPRAVGQQGGPRLPGAQDRRETRAGPPQTCGSEGHHSSIEARARPSGAER